MRENYTGIPNAVRITAIKADDYWKTTIDFTQYSDEVILRAWKEWYAYDASRTEFISFLQDYNEEEKGLLERDRIYDELWHEKKE